MEEIVECEFFPLFRSNQAFVLPNGDSLLTKTRETHLNCALNPISSPPLFVDDIWPGSKVLANFLVTHPEYVTGKCILEFGAGGALPSCAALKLQPSLVVVSDYPAQGVLENIKNVLSDNHLIFDYVHVVGFIWGESTTPLLDFISSNSKFQLILLAELLWKDTSHLHRDLLQSVKECLEPTRVPRGVELEAVSQGGLALVSFAHRPTLPSQSTLPHTPEDDLMFFSLAEEMGFLVSALPSCSLYSDPVDTEELPETSSSLSPFSSISRPAEVKMFSLRLMEWQ